ncbi:hypothetical protein Mal52_30780 [Symmachiella dynata]|uniref:Peptidase family M48 n=2 Tax=Symmachiella dynata TaxID=2527995 RepID=A0A517ZQ75_9PLAN|nr:hypothetical protein Mal52_30780 [Symmachiella dynata]
MASHTPAQLKFHKAMRSHGGRLPWELLPPSSKAVPTIYKIANDLISRARGLNPRLPEIQFDFINSNAINGIACKWDHEYFIGITGGAVTLLQLVLHRVFADPKLFPDIGDPSMEEPSPPFIKSFTPDAMHLLEGDTLVCIPKDEARWTYSCRLINLAAIFLIGHEIAHISCGHVDYLCAKTGSQFLAEFGATAAGAIEPIERQIIEAQADQYSFNSLLGGACAQSSENTGAPTREELASLGQLAFDYSFSANILFRLFGDMRFIGSDFAVESYPPIALRRSFIYGGGCDLVRKELTPDRQDTVLRALEAGMFAAEHAFSGATGEDVAVTGLEEAFSDKGHAHFKRLVELSDRELAEKLQPFSYC